MTKVEKSGRVDPFKRGKNKDKKEVIGMKRMAGLFALILLLSVTTTQARAATWKDGSVVHIGTEERVIALTFDDGPHPRYTARILEVLAKYDVKATFFMVGIQVERYGDAARAVAEAGHEIGNHTYHHARLAGMSADEIGDEVEACERRILEITGVKTSLFRAPEGMRGEVLYRTLEARGYRQILWNVDTLDWQGRSGDAITASVLQGVRGGDIILCHDYVSGKLRVDSALERIIPALLSQGYRFLTVSEMLACGEVITPRL